MKKQIILTTLLLTVMVCTGMIFAGGQPEKESAEMKSGIIPMKEQGDSSVAVTDFLGREVTVKIPVQKIVFTHYATAEALKILDAWDLVVGRDGYTSDRIIYPNLDEIPALTEMLGAPYSPNKEMLISLNPDLLILEVIPMPGIDALIEDLEGVVPVITVKTYDPEAMFDSFAILGTILGREKEAKAFISWVKNEQNELLAKTGTLTDAEKTTMFYKTGYGNASELGTFSDEMSYVPARNRISGCINIAADLPSQGGWIPAVDAEWIAEQDIDVLIIGDPQPGAYGVLQEDTARLAEHRKKVMELPVFAEKTAVKTGRVYMLGDAFFGTPRHIVGFAYLAKWFHPDLFQDMDPAGLHQEYFNNFLKVEYDVINKGIFVYPKE